MKKLIPLLLVFALTGCFLVAYDGGWWDKGTIDKNLLGKWVATDDVADGKVFGQEVYFHDSGAGYMLFPDKNLTDSRNNYYKTINLDGLTFLLSKKPNERGFMLIYYRINDGVLSFYIPNMQRAQEFIKKYVEGDENLVRADNGSVGIVELNASAVKKLVEIHKDIINLQPWAIFKKSTEVIQHTPIEVK